VDLDFPAIAAGAFVAAYVLAPLEVLCHELGHAHAALRAGRRPTVRVGRQPAPLQRRFRHLDLHFNPRLNLSGGSLGGTCEWDSRGLTVAQLRRILSAGPHVSATVGVVCGLLAYLLAGVPLLFWSLAFTSVASLGDAAVNLLPITGATINSDGAEMAKLQGLSPATVLWPLP
jgi:hypothetical protein